MTPGDFKIFVAESGGKLMVFENTPLPAFGKVMEYAYWSRCLTDAEKQTVVSYFKGKYGI